MGFLLCVLFQIRRSAFCLSVCLSAACTGKGGMLGALTLNSQAQMGFLSLPSGLQDTKSEPALASLANSPRRQSWPIPEPSRLPRPAFPGCKFLDICQHTLAGAGPAGSLLRLPRPQISVCLLPTLTADKGPGCVPRSFSRFHSLCGFRAWPFLRACPEGARSDLALARAPWVQHMPSWYLASKVTHSLHRVYLRAYPATILLNKYSARHFTPWLFAWHFHDLSGARKGRRQRLGKQ